LKDNEYFGHALGLLLPEAFRISAFIDKFEQDRQCAYNVILRCVRTTILEWKSSKCYIFWECVGGLTYPACNVHAPYSCLWSARLSNIFSMLSHSKKKSFWT